jgi:uncharacterized protein (DUF58 family)
MMHERGKNVGYFKSVMIAYLILALHLLLVAGIGLLVIFFRGVVHYMFWIFLGGSLILFSGSVYFYRKLRVQGKTLKETLKSPLFDGRALEVSFLGGIASVKIGGSAGEPKRIDHSTKGFLRLEGPETTRIRELSDLARLLESDLITREEYDQEKSRILHGTGTPDIESR